MNISAVYTLLGFNDQSSDTIIKPDGNIEYEYPDHECLAKAVINDSFTNITFYLKDGLPFKPYRQIIENELRRILFNMIAYSEVCAINPGFELSSVIDESGSTVMLELHDSINISCEVTCQKNCNANSLVDSIFLTESKFEEFSAKYIELFWILDNPHLVIQFFGLYDIMSELISEKKAQKYVHTYFRKNSDKYPFVSFMISSKDNKTEEDNFTHLRNTIAHSQQAGVQEFIKTAEMINVNHIKCLLQVINDLLCNKYPKG